MFPCTGGELPSRARRGLEASFYPFRPRLSGPTHCDDHLAGEHTVGVYPLLEDDPCYFFEKAQLPQVLANRLIRLAAFQNPEFYKAQAMRISVWDKPRVIGCAENYPQHIALPRG